MKIVETAKAKSTDKKNEASDLDGGHQENLGIKEEEVIREGKKRL